MNVPTLYILCGPAGCGKTTWAFNYMDEHEDEDIRYVSRDEIRFLLLKEGENYFSHEKEAFHKFVTTLAQTLVDGFDVIADATHLNEFSRYKLTRAIDQYTKNYNIVYIVFYTKMNVSMERNAQRTGRERVPDNIMRQMYENFQVPTQTEDFRAKGIIEVEE